MREQLAIRRAAELAAAQGGAIGADQLSSLGFSSSAIARRVAAGELHAVHHGVYAWGHRLLTPAGRVFAAVLACGPGAAASHRAAAAVHGLLPHVGGPVRVTVPTYAGRARQRGIRVHRRRVLAWEVADVDGLPVTAVDRTIADLAEVCTARILEQAIAVADRRHLADARVLRAYALSGRRGSRALRAALGVPITFTRSGLERRFLSLCEDAGLPRPLVNGIVEGLEVDFHWPALGLIVETDGGDFHTGPTTEASDAAREARLAARGWLVVRFTAEDVYGDPAGVVAVLRPLIECRLLPGMREQVDNRGAG